MERIESRQPVDLRWFVDETSMGMARAIAAVRKDVCYPGHRRLSDVPLGTIDSVWMPLVASWASS